MESRDPDACERSASQLPKDSIRSAGKSNWGLHFDDPDVEGDYCRKVSSGVHRQMQTFGKVINFVAASFLIVDQGTEYFHFGRFKPPYQFFMEFLAYFLTLPILNLALVCLSEKRSEYIATGILFTVMVAWLTLNPIRLARLGLLAKQSPTNETWLRKCSADLVESSRDTLRVFVAHIVHSYFHIFVRPRTKITLLVPGCLFISYWVGVLFFSPVMPEDHTYSFYNFLLLCTCAGHWYGSYCNERQDRVIWSLRRKIDAFEQSDALLRLVFAAVVSVSLDGRIIEGETLEGLFGIKVSNLTDLPTQDEQEQLSADLQALVAMVHASSIPAKRKVMIRPARGTTVFLCNVCAVVTRSENSEGVLIGIDIQDTWESIPSGLRVNDPAGCMSEGSGGEQGARGRDSAADLPSHSLSDEGSSVDDDASTEASLLQQGTFQVPGSSARLGQQSALRKASLPRSFKIFSSEMRFKEVANPAVLLRPTLQLDAHLHTTSVKMHWRPSMRVSNF
jgi:hypothetical protein